MRLVRVLREGLLSRDRWLGKLRQAVASECQAPGGSVSTGTLSSNRDCFEYANKPPRLSRTAPPQTLFRHFRRPRQSSRSALVHAFCLTTGSLPLSPSIHLRLLPTACPATMASNGAQQVFQPVLAAQHTMMSSADTATKNQAHKFLEEFQKSVRTLQSPSDVMANPPSVGRGMDRYISYVGS